MEKLNAAYMEIIIVSSQFSSKSKIVLKMSLTFKAYYN